jgi:hypothetical protein
MRVGYLISALISWSVSFRCRTNNGAAVFAVTLALSGAPNEPASLADFVDVASKSGLTMVNVFGGGTGKEYILESTGTGVAVFDYDNDGWPDIFFVNGTRLMSGEPDAPRNYLYRNNHDGTFTDVTEQTGLEASGWGQGVCVGDYDNDGWEDLYVTYYGKNRLYHNRHGVFEEVAEQAGVAGDGSMWGSGCAFVDYDRDGLLDLVVANYVDFRLDKAPQPGKDATCQWKGIAVFCGPRGLARSGNVLYRNLGNGKFRDVSQAAHLDRTLGHFCFSVSPFDYDNDGWPDIYIACDSTPSILYHNNHDGTFNDVGIMAGVAYNEDGREQSGMGSAIADYDGDGQLDVFRTNFSEDTSTLFHNDGNGNFTDVTYPAGIGVNTRYLGWGVAFFDFDNDGWPDLILANGHVYPEVDALKLDIHYKEPKVLYHNLGNKTFADVSRMAGAGISAPAAARGLAIGDFWNDGRQSVVIANMNSTPSLLVNQMSNSNHWIAFKTAGARSNRDGIGARLSLVSESRQQVDEVRSGSSYISNSDRRVHFGLGAEPKLKYLEVWWPSGARERFRELRADTIMTINEGSGKPVEAPSMPK